LRPFVDGGSIVQGYQQTSNTEKGLAAKHEFYQSLVVPTCDQADETIQHLLVSYVFTRQAVFEGLMQCWPWFSDGRGPFASMLADSCVTGAQEVHERIPWCPLGKDGLETQEPLSLRWPIGHGPSVRQVLQEAADQAHL